MIEVVIEKVDKSFDICLFLFSDMKTIVNCHSLMKKLREFINNKEFDSIEDNINRFENVITVILLFNVLILLFVCINIIITCKYKCSRECIAKSSKEQYNLIEKNNGSIPIIDISTHSFEENRISSIDNN